MSNFINETDKLSIVPKKELEKKVVNINAEKRKTPLMMAAKKGLENLVELLIEKGANIHARDDEDWTALMFAVCGGHVSIAKRLIEAGADVNCVSEHGTTPLIASYDTNKEMVKMLLDAGADVKVRSKISSSTSAGILYFVCARHEKGEEAEEMVRLLIEAGADVNG